MGVDKVVQYVPAHNSMLWSPTSLNLLLLSEHPEQPEKLGHRPGTLFCVVYIY